MLYRPNYCCHCGEKIERAKWTPLTSRRFCDFCEIEQKQHDLLPRVVLLVAVLLGAAGLTSYLGRSDQTSSTAQSTASRPREPNSERIRSTGTEPAPTAKPSESLSAERPGSQNVAANLEQRRVPPISSTEPVHYCGALTKKGTPCTRRVKSKGRCWQHAGQRSEPEL